MERNEMVEIIIAKADVTREEAAEVLEKCNWDIVDSIIYLERMGRVENNEATTIIEVKAEDQDEKENSENHKERYGGVGEIMGRIFKAIGKLVKKGNEIYFEVKKENSKSIRVSLTISVLLLIFASVPAIVLLIIGLFCGYRYSLSGSHMSFDGVNNIFEKASGSADTIKKDFREGYGK